MEGETAVDWSKHKWCKPEKTIKDMADLDRFAASPSYQEYVSFVTAMQAAVESKPISHTQPIEKTRLIVGLLDRLIALVDEVPPIQQAMRFGNTAFKIWHERALAVSTS